jgi:hypothetical protein
MEQREEQPFDILGGMSDSDLSHQKFGVKNVHDSYDQTIKKISISEKNDLMTGQISSQQNKIKQQEIMIQQL